jgi:uncharacterized protein YuzE
MCERKLCAAGFRGGREIRFAASTAESTRTWRRSLLSIENRHLRILFRNAPIEESDEDKPGVILDYDKEGNVVGLEVLNASQRIENPRALDYAVTA